MFKKSFSSFSSNDLAKSKDFYEKTLELKVEELPKGMGLSLIMPDEGTVYIYEKSDHKPAEFTVLNFIVDDIDKAVSELKSKGIHFEHYDNIGAPQDENEILRGLSVGMGPDIAWFKDPSGNILSLLQQE